jgi:hypothetical protein
VRLYVALAGIALVAGVGGCTSDDKSPTWNGASSAPAISGSAPAFTEPAAYTYVLTRGCDDAKPLGKYKATVQNGAVTKSERVGGDVQPSASTDVDLGPITGQDGEEIEVPTLSELRDLAQTASDDGGQVTTTFDGKDGHPVKVVIDVSEGPECFTVSDYTPGP